MLFILAAITVHSLNTVVTPSSSFLVKVGALISYRGKGESERLQSAELHEITNISLDCDSWHLIQRLPAVLLHGVSHQNGTPY